MNFLLLDLFGLGPGISIDSSASWNFPSDVIFQDLDEMSHLVTDELDVTIFMRS